jgi:hypothetical protein
LQFWSPFLTSIYDYHEFLVVYLIVAFLWDYFCEKYVSHPIMCDNRLGNMYNLRENMANLIGE